MESKKNPLPDTGTYQTGRTEPPRRYSGLVAVLLVLVILLCGISTALSILNFKLYRQLSLQPSAPPVAFSRSGEESSSTLRHGEDVELEGFGLRGSMIPVVYQRYYKLPAGFYVNRVTVGSQAAAGGMITGDIITAIGDLSINEDTTRETLMEAITPGKQTQLQIYRSGAIHTLTLTWKE